MVTIPEPAPRKSPFWIDSFIDLTNGAQSPVFFRQWAAVAILSGAMERKTWLKAFKRILYPNLYILLTGGPGIGKTDALREVHKFWEALPTLNVAPSSVSRASLIDALHEADRTILRPADIPPITQFNSLQIAATEFGTFLSAYETEFLSTLNDLYDCVRYKEQKRHMKKPIEMPRPQLSLIAGTTPAWLGGTLPETAWAEGFSSRLLMIYSGERVRVADPFAEDDRDEALEEDLKDDLQAVHNLYGQFLMEDEFVGVFKAWYLTDCQPQPSHPKLEHYIPRRHIHFLKLCMVMSVSRSNELVLRLIDYQRAMAFLLEAEEAMPDVFKAMRTGGDSNTIDEAYNFVYTTFAKEGKAVPEHRIMHFLMTKLPSHSVSKVLEVMVASNVLIVDSIGEKGRNTYRPSPRGTF